MPQEPEVMSNARVRVEHDSAWPGTARIVIDNPPVNAGSIDVRRGLLAAIHTLEAAADIHAAVLIGAGKTFIAGADIREFDAPPLEPQLPTVIAAIEDCSKPIVAAIHGAALGGGFEVALGCDARVASADAAVGLPEVALGIIPGAGGTVRLTRLCDGASALELIVSGRRLPAAEALELGLVDAIAEGDLVDFAMQYAASWKQGKRRLRDRPAVVTPAVDLDSAAAAAARKAKGRPAALEAVSAVKRALEEPFSAALAEERSVFLRLRQSAEAAALRHLFFAEREAGRIDVGPEVTPAINSVAVIGAGLMGAGIASAFLAAHFPVTVVETNAGALERGQGRIEQIGLEAVKAGRIGEPERVRRAQNLTLSTDLAAVASADLIVEAVFEDMDVKQALFVQLDRIAHSGAILASNTSYLDINAIAAVTNRPESVVGLHFFSPAHVMRLVEVVRGARTASGALAAAAGIARRLKKLPVIAGVGEGFIGNRIFMAYRTQCEYMLEEGAMPEDIDRALTDFGFAMGPFAVWDLAGLDIAWNTRQRLRQTWDPRERVVPLLDRLVERGRLGRKTGAGWYRYEADRRNGIEDQDVRDLILEASAERGVVRRAISDAEIVARAMAAIINEGALILGEGIAERPSDVDLVLVNGYGFPAYRGGPLFWARRQPRAEILAAIDLIKQATGSTFRGGPIVERILESK